MAENNLKGSQGNSTDDVRLMDAYAARTGATDDAIDPSLDDELQRELAAYVTLSRRIAAIDDQPVAPSVRGAILSEAAKLSAERAEQPRNGLIEMLLAMLRPGPVMAFGALAAIALAISVRQDPATNQSPIEPSMRAMGGAPKAAEAVALAPTSANLTNLYPGARTIPSRASTTDELVWQYLGEVNHLARQSTI